MTPMLSLTLFLVSSSASPVCSTNSTLAVFGNAAVSTSGNGSVVGDVYLMDSSTMTLSGNGKVSGTVHEETSGSIRLSGNAKVGSTAVADLSTLESGLITMASEAANQTATQSVGGVNGTTTITGNGGVNVVKVNGPVQLS
jgi:hypothetical protein